MGCCTSTKVVQSAVQPLLHQNDLSGSQLYIMGALAQSKFVFSSYDPDTGKLTNILHKIQQFKPTNYSSMIYINSTKNYIITGGVDYELSNIKNYVYQFNPKQYKIQQLCPMYQPRYTHNSVYYKDYVYVFGGRYYGDDDQGILSQCERYKVSSNQWEKIKKMPNKRCTGSSVIWNEKIYLFGGYRAQYQRPTSIDQFDLIKLDWRTLDVQLNKGVQSALVTSVKHNQFMIFGGLTNSGGTNKVLAINLKQQIVVANKQLKTQKIMAKGCYHNGIMHILGGSSDLTVQKYDIINQSSTISNIGLAGKYQHDNFEALTFSQRTVMVQYREEDIQMPKHQYQEEIVYIFGTTEQPFILEFNISVPYIRKLGIPMNMKLYCHQGGVNIMNQKILLFGGIQDSLDNVTSETYLYNHNEKKAQLCNNMNYARYAFAYEKLGQFVYVMGGGYSQQGQLNILSSCERFNIRKKNWQIISSLPQGVISPMSLIYKNQLYTFGGTLNNKQRQQIIMKYDANKDTWNPLKFKMQFGIEAGCIFQNEQKQFYIFGGRLVNGDTNGIWSLSFIGQGNQIDCVFTEKGRMSEAKCLHKIFNPKHQDFLVIFGGQKDPISCYQRNSLKKVQSDTLLGIKELFLQNFSLLNYQSMKNYLVVIKQC